LIFEWVFLINLIMKTKFVAIAAALQLFSSVLSSQNCKEVVGYLPDWQWYDRNRLVNPMTIDYSQYTVLNYCFFQPMSNGSIQLGDSWAEQNLLQGQIDWNTNTYIPNTSVVDRAHNANVKVLVSIGGWTWSNNFPSIAADPQKRAVFAHDCNYYVQYYNLDGIDIDWEYPGFADHGGGPADAANFTLLLQQIRDSLNALELVSGEQYLLTAAVGASSTHMSNVQWNNVVPLLDMINLMSYDFFGAWDASANHNSPLYAPTCGDPSFNIHSAFTTLTNTYGVPAAKVNIGLAFYGRTQSGFTSLCSATSGTAATMAFPPDGVPLYYEILNSIGLYSPSWDNAAGVPWLNGNGVFVSYDDERSIALKAQYINTCGARGAIVWEITGDYIETSPGSGIIAGTPLADTLNAVFCSNITLGNQETISHQNTIICYPNPVKDVVAISFYLNNSVSAEILITDISGRKIADMVLSGNFGENKTVVSTQQFLPGLYLVYLRDGKENLAVTRFLVSE
jgi:GH18 family chitinase